MTKEELSPMASMVKGILFDFRSKTLTARHINAITTRIVKGILMTREGAGLPAEGTATNFSENEVRGDLVDEKVQEALAEKKAKKALEVLEQEEKQRVRVAAIKAEAEENAKYKVRVIVATPGTGDPGSPEEVGPVAYKIKK